MRQLLTTPASGRVQPAAPPATLPSQHLFGAAKTVLIEHAGQRYTLRITRENKLILTK